MRPQLLVVRKAARAGAAGRHRTESKQMIERARIILGCLAGQRFKEVLVAVALAPIPLSNGGDVCAVQLGRLAGCARLEPNRLWRGFPQPGAGLLEQPLRRAKRAGTVGGGRRAPRLGGMQCGGCCAMRDLLATQRSWCVSTDKDLLPKRLTLWIVSHPGKGAVIRLMRSPAFRL